MPGQPPASRDGPLRDSKGSASCHGEQPEKGPAPPYTQGGLWGCD